MTSKSSLAAAKLLGTVEMANRVQHHGQMHLDLMEEGAQFMVRHESLSAEEAITAVTAGMASSVASAIKELEKKYGKEKADLLRTIITEF